MSELPESIDDPQRATDHAVRLLSMRARTRRELELGLQRRGYSERAIGTALTRVVELGYLDDASYARTRATSLLREAKMGPAGVVQRLVARGVPESDAKQAVKTACRELGASNENLARRLLENKGLLSRSLSVKDRARAERLLAARGFEADLAAALLGEPVLDPHTQRD
ncbi:MAG: regulatory protein RecX [Myxococcaceae bacterium]